MRGLNQSVDLRVLPFPLCFLSTPESQMRQVGHFRKEE